MAGSRVWISAMLLAVLASCGPPSREPRAIRPESDVCAECRMTVLPGYAAQAIDSEGLVRMFDDPGCLALHVHDHPDEYQDAVFFVQDQETGEWIEGTRVFFVRADEVPTPMNYGWHAFGDRERAEAFALVHSGTVAADRGFEALAPELEGRRWRP